MIAEPYIAEFERVEKTQFDFYEKLQAFVEKFKLLFSDDPRFIAELEKSGFSNKKELVSFLNKSSKEFERDADIVAKNYLTISQYSLELTVEELETLVNIKNTIKVELDKQIKFIQEIIISTHTLLQRDYYPQSVNKALLRLKRACVMLRNSQQNILRLFEQTESVPNTYHSHISMDGLSEIVALTTKEIK